MESIDGDMTQGERYKLEADLVGLEMLQGFEPTDERQKEIDKLREKLGG